MTYDQRLREVADQIAAGLERRPTSEELLAQARDEGDLEWEVTAECIAAQDGGREISDECAATIAAWFTDASRDASAFTATGAISDPTRLYRGLFYMGATPMYPTMPAYLRLCADMMGTYLIHAGPRGPVTGWAPKAVDR